MRIFGGREDECDKIVRLEGRIVTPIDGEELGNGINYVYQMKASNQEV